MSNYAKYKDLGDGNKTENFNSQSGKQAPSSKFSVYELKSKEDKNTLIKNNRLCVVDIWADWCQPCKQIAGRYSQLAQKYTRLGECVVVKENVESKFSDNIRGVPTFHFFKNGELLNDKTVMGGDIKKVEETIEELLHS
jgi:thioredoxin 1